MKDMAKMIIIGPQCSGKTTVAEDLRNFHRGLNVIDEDDEINRRNGGKSPSNWTEWNHKWNVLRPDIHRDILRMDVVIFFTSYFDEKLLLFARLNGFTVVQFVTKEKVLQERNKKRMESGVDDATYGWTMNLPYHEAMRKHGFIDVVIETDCPVKEISASILATAKLFERKLRMFPNPYWVRRQMK